MVVSAKIRMIEQLRREIPPALRELPNWVAWTANVTTDTSGQIKTRKVPIEVKHGRIVGNARSNDPSTWTELEDTLAAYGQDGELEGVGFQFGASADKRTGYVGIDLDACDDWATLANWLIGQFESWSERSQSGSGRHIFVRGTLPRAIKIDKGNTAGIKHRAMEMYDHSRFFAMTGDRVGKAHDICERQEMVDVLFTALETYDKLLKWVKRLAETDEKRAKEFVTLWNGTDASESKSNGDWALCGQLISWAKGDARVADLLFRMSERYAARENSDKAWDSPRHGSNRHPEQYDEPLYPDRPLGEELTYGELTMGKRLYEWRKRQQEKQAIRDAFSAEVAETLSTAKLTQAGDAECFQKMYDEKLLWNATDDVWMRFNGVIWERDDKYPRTIEALDVMRTRAKYALALDDEEVGQELYVYASSRGCEAETHLAHVSNLASRSMCAKQLDFDTQDEWVATKNMALNLVTGEVRAARPEDRFSKRLGVDYDPAAECPRWRQFMTEVFPDAPETVAYLQRAVGYCLTSSTEEQVIFLMVGTGSNGKSLFLNIVGEVMGDYWQPASFTAFGTGSGPKETAARLYGARFATVIETSEDWKLDEAKIKSISGGDRIPAERKFGHEFSYDPQFKLWMAVNREPRIIGTDNGIWRRIQRVNFTQVFDAQNAENRKLRSVLRTELPGILNWALEGVRMWHEHGLSAPEGVRAATETYRNESNLVLAWLNEECVVVPEDQRILDVDWNNGASTDKYTVAQDAYRSYTFWAKERGLHIFPINTWSSRLKELGHDSEKRWVKDSFGKAMKQKRVYRSFTCSSGIELEPR